MPYPLNLLDNIDNYRRLFTDAAFFRPVVEEICRRHGLMPYERIRVGVPGTFPVFIVENRWLVKLFGRLFDGGRSYAVELAAAHLLREHPLIPTPDLLAAGQLEATGVDWPWPYLVFAFIPGVSLGEVRGQVSLADELQMARELGAWVRELHGIAIPPEGPCAVGWEAYLNRLDGQRAACADRQREWGTLPAHLLEQVDSYLLPSTDLRLPDERPHFIHADLTEDHLLGQVTAGRWTSMALIDFGDACTGSLFYELGALHLSLFNADRRLLSAFLEAYGYTGPSGADFARRVMSCALLHEFNVFGSQTQRPDFRGVATLTQMGEALWNPG